MSLDARVCFAQWATTLSLQSTVIVFEAPDKPVVRVLACHGVVTLDRRKLA